MTFSIDNKQIYFRCDFGGNIGRGHLSRCLNLAYAFSQKGFEPVFLIRKRPGIRHEKLEFRVIWLQETVDVTSADVETWLNESMETEATEVLNVLGGDSVLVLDHYSLGDAYQKRIKEHGHRVVLFQDIYSSNFCADILINYNVGAELIYKNIFNPTGTKILSGPSYAPLAPIYSKEHTNRVRQVSQCKTVGIYLGGIDKKYLEKLAVSLNEVKFLSLKKIHWIVNSEEEKGAVQKSFKSNNCHVQVRIPDMFELYNKVELFIGSCGLSFLERACLGLWQLNFLVADNQKDIADYINRNNCGGYLGDIRVMPGQEMIQALNSLLQLPMTDHVSSVDKAFLLTDGQGASRICQQIVEGL